MFSQSSCQEVAHSRTALRDPCLRSDWTAICAPKVVFCMKTWYDTVIRKKPSYRRCYWERWLIQSTQSKRKSPGNEAVSAFPYPAWQTYFLLPFPFSGNTSVTQEATHPKKINSFFKELHDDERSDICHCGEVNWGIYPRNQSDLTWVVKEIKTNKNYYCK